MTVHVRASLTFPDDRDADTKTVILPTDFVTKGTTRDPLGTRATARLLPKLADYGPEQVYRQRPRSGERGRTRPIRVDGMRAAETSRHRNRDRALGARRFEGNPRQTTALPVLRSSAP